MIEKAKQGNGEAMYNIGCEYASKENTEMAILWLGTSSALGFYESQIKLGDLFKVDNPVCASKWYRRARSNGIAHAGSRIGDEFFKNKQYRETESEYIEAVKHGDPYSQNRLGMFYRDGYYDRNCTHRGVNISEAFKWL